MVDFNKKYLTGSLLSGLFFFASNQTNAQVSFSQFQNQHTFSQASQYMPSFIGEGVRKFKITFFDFYADAGNNSLTLDALNHFLNAKQLTEQTVDSVLSVLKNQNNIYAGAAISILNTEFNIRKKTESKFLSFSLGARERMDMNLLYSQNLISLLYKGNKQFEGKTVTLGPLAINFLQCTDYYFGARTQLKFKVGKNTLLKVKPAMQFHYLTSLANVYTKSSSLSLFTQTDGRELDLNYNYDINIASPGDRVGVHGLLGDINAKDITKNFFKGVGSGTAFDFGCGVDVNDWIKINAAVTDVGSISFKNHAANISNSSQIKFDGFDLSYSETTTGIKTQLDSMVSLLKPTVTTAGYKVPLATKVFVNTSINLLKKRKKNNTVYFRHRFNFTYIKGFSDYLNSTKKPLATIGYNYSIGNIVNAGLVAATGGLTGKSLGANLSFQFSHYQIWMSSNNLLSIISPYNTKSINGSIGMGMEF